MIPKLESRGFYIFLGMLLALLILQRSYKGIVIKDKPANVTEMREVAV